MTVQKANPEGDVEKLGLRAARMQRVRAALRQEALRRFEADSYESVTVDVIAEAVGVSRRTVFRYFGGKDGLIFDGARQRLDAFEQSLVRALPDEDAWARVRRALLETAAVHMAERQVLLREYRIIRASHELVGRELELDLGWEAAMGACLADDLDPWRADLLAGALMGLIRATIRRWYEGGCKGDLVSDGVRALSLITPSPFTAGAAEGD